MTKPIYTFNWLIENGFRDNGHGWAIKDSKEEPFPQLWLSIEKGSSISSVHGDLAVEIKTPRTQEDVLNLCSALNI